MRTAMTTDFAHCQVAARGLIIAQAAGVVKAARRNPPKHKGE